MVGYPFAVKFDKNKSDNIFYATGQPMGAYSS